MFQMDIGIDLGTNNTLVYVSKKGIALREPTLVAVDAQRGTVLAVGQEAKAMIGRSPGNISAVHPLQDGVIADFDRTQAMLKHFIQKATRKSGLLTRIRVVICVPSGVTTVEERAVREAALAAGANDALLVEQPIAAAIGCGIDVLEPSGHLLVDIGGGTTEVALVSLGGLVAVRSVRAAGNAIDHAIAAHIRRTYNLGIGERTAEDIKLGIGNVYLDEHTRFKAMEIRGRDTVSGMPRTVEITAREVNAALAEPLQIIIDAIKSCLEVAPPELAADIIERGITLTGGGALLYGLDKLISRETRLSVQVAEDPMGVVAAGTGKIAENLGEMRRVLVTSSKQK